MSKDVSDEDLESAKNAESLTPGCRHQFIFNDVREEDFDSDTNAASLIVLWQQ